MTTARQVEPVLRELFRRWPNQWAMDEALIVNPGRRDVEALIRPLGLVTGRLEAIEDICDTSISHHGMRKRDRVDSLRAARGVGQYGEASMRAFCLGDLGARTSDEIVMARIRHLRRRKGRGA